jgi:choline kinase
MSGISKGVIVAAGLGARLQQLGNGNEEIIKPLQPIGGKPLLQYVIGAAASAGLKEIIIVTGFGAGAVDAWLASTPLPVKVRTVYNKDYRLSNGISLLKGGEAAGEDFVLLMSDHLFQPAILREMLKKPLGTDLARLAVDQKIDAVFDLDDATKVQLYGDRIVSIGKGLEEYNAVDCGIFQISQRLIKLMAGIVEEEGDLSISRGMDIAISGKAMGYHDIGRLLWQDVDTLEMFHKAEQMLKTGQFD